MEQRNQVILIHVYMIIIVSRFLIVCVPCVLISHHLSQYVLYRNQDCLHTRQISGMLQKSDHNLDASAHANALDDLPGTNDRRRL